MANGKVYLDCPLCGEPVTTIPACNDAHRDCAGVPPRATHPVWCEDRHGTCEHCGAVLSVNVDWEDGATLVATNGKVTLAELRADVTVTALFIDPSGPYPALLGKDRCWDESRDARLFKGAGGPVVAHPPCNVWCGMARLNEKRYGHRVGDDGGCFQSALRSVLRCGGVLEHPAGSIAWSHFGLPKPIGKGWTDNLVFGGERFRERVLGSTRQWRACEVWQSAYGHRARKRTWLFYVGDRPPFDLDWARPVGTHQIGWFDISKPVLSKTESKRTPVAFAEALIRLAAWSGLRALRDGALKEG